MTARAHSLRRNASEAADAWAAARRVFPHVRHRDIAQAARVSLRIRRRIVGRYCGHRGDHFAQFLAALSAGRADGSCRIVEIGSLFGGSAANFALACHWAGLHPTITCIDPLDGMWGVPVDPITKVPVSPAMLRRNLRRLALDPDAFDVRALRSDHADADAGIAAGSVDLLLIDGLHTFDGVCADIKRYVPLVRDGGLVLFDDYANPNWPDVSRAVATAFDLKSGALGVVGTTLVVRVSRHA